MATKLLNRRLIAPAAGITGAVVLLVLGSIGNEWLLGLKHNSGIAMDYDTMPHEFEDYHLLLQVTVFCSLMCGLVGLIFSIQLFRGKGDKWTNASLISIAGAVPLVLWSLLYSRVPGVAILPPVLLLAGGLFAFLNPERIEVER